MDVGVASTIAKIYDDLVASYDESQAGRDPLAAEYPSFIKIKEGLTFLDFRYVTDFVTFELKYAVGARGRVVGVDISESILAIARQPNRQNGAHIDFYKHDVMDLGNLTPEETLSFEHILCVGGLMYLNTLKALEHWKEFLIPGGSIVADVPVEHGQIGLQLMSHAGTLLWVTLLWTFGWVESIDSVLEMWESVGLVDVEVFETKPYLVRKLDRNAGERLFERTWRNPVVEPLADAQPQSKVKALFFSEFEKLAGEDDIVMQELRFYIRNGRGV